MSETDAYGFDKVRDEQQELGNQVRGLMNSHGFKSLAADQYGAPGVVVCYTDDPDIHNGSKFAKGWFANRGRCSADVR